MILIADDEPAVKIVIAQMISHLNLKVISVTNGLEALEALNKNEFDLVMLDLNMPVMCGKEAYLHIRAELPHQKIVILTGCSVDALGQEFLDDHYLWWLQKPVEFSELTSVLNQAGVIC